MLPHASLLPTVLPHGYSEYPAAGTLLALSVWVPGIWRSQKDGRNKRRAVACSTPPLLLRVDVAERIREFKLEHSEARRTVHCYVYLHQASINQGGEMRIISSEAFSSPARQIASAASSVQPPTNTPSERKHCCCVLVSNS